jgi:hypothetical protein
MTVEGRIPALIIAQKVARLSCRAQMDGAPRGNGNGLRLRSTGDAGAEHIFPPQ